MPLPTPADLSEVDAALRAVVDQRQDWEAFSRPCDDASGYWESHVAIEGMHCAACSLTVESALRAVPGVRGALVNGASQLARVVWSPDATRPSAWFAAVARAGYRSVPVADLLQGEATRQAQRLMLWRWLVAGFCMMQVMMYAVPAYVAQPGELTSEMARLLRWASWVLSLPVLVFSCRPFFASALRDVRQGRVGMDVPVALGIVIAFVASTAATVQPTGPWGHEVWYDSLTMFVFFLLSGRMLEQRLRDRTAGALQALSRRLPDSVQRRVADGGFERVAVHRLVPGDVIRLLPGEAFPADGELLEGETQVDEALLTGESRPLLRRAGPQGLSSVIAGSHNLTGVVLVRVLRTGAQTRYAAIVALMQQAAADKPALAQLADRIARPFLVGVLLASALAALWWWPIDPSQAIGVAIAVLIVTCPCALSLATPAATLAAAGALARRGTLVRRLQAFETATRIDTVVFDKTGTLTHDRMAVGAVYTRDGSTADQALRLAAALAQHSLHPVSRALVAAAPPGTAQVTDVQELPGQGLRASAGAGMAGGVLRLGSARFCNAPAPQCKGDGQQVHLADSQGWLASFDLSEALRPDARAAVQALRDMGLTVQLLSGDRAGAVQALARSAGIDAAFGECSPEDKLAHVRSLQQRGHRVAMVGDGINDAPVLALADLSVTLGQASALARSRADAVVLGGQLGGVPSLLQLAKRTRGVVRQNMAWALAYNLVCVPLAVVGWMPAWLAGLGMAASSLAVVLNASRLARNTRVD